MTTQRILTYFSYVLVGGAALIFAVFIATRFISQGRAENASATTGAQPTITPLTQPQPVESKSPSKSETVSNSVPLPSNIRGGAFLEPYVFDTREGRRNPFRPPQINDFGATDLMLPGTPLERFELDELRLVGIMWDVKSPKAMIIDPQGEVHTVGKDDRVGRKRGYVAAIREGEVVVIETTTFGGENTFSTRILRVEQ